MTNDTTTLNGALMEVGEIMAENLTKLGIPSSANEGLITLANKIDDVTVVLYENTGDTINGLVNGTNGTCSTNGSYITFTGTSYSNMGLIFIGIYLPNKWIFECQIAELGVSYDCYVGITNTTSSINLYVTGTSHSSASSNKWNSYFSGSSSLFGSPASKDDVLKLVYDGINMKTYVNNVLYEDVEVSIPLNSRIYFSCRGAYSSYIKDITQNIKNIKLSTFY